MSASLTIEIIAQKIFVIRGHKVMLDWDLAKLYGVPTKSLNLAVKRNISRFPEDFMLRLNKDEMESLRFQIETSKEGRGGRRYPPYAFTEQGVAMLSSVLHSERAIQVNIQIMRTFAKLKEYLLTHKELSVRLDVLEKKFGEHDEKIRIIFEAIRRLLEPSQELPKPKIGFHPL